MPDSPSSSQRFVGGLFLFQRLLQQLHRLVHSQQLGVGPETAIGGNLVVLDSLSRRDQRRVNHRPFAFFFDHLFAFLNQALHSLTGLAPGGLAQLLEDLLQPLNMTLGFLLVLGKRLLQLL